MSDAVDALIGRYIAVWNEVNARRRRETIRAIFVHNQVLFGCSFGPPGASQPAATGADVAILERGRIARLHGSVDRQAQ